MARTGRPIEAEPGKPRSREWLQARIEIDPVTGCWLWKGDRSRRGGYGRVYIGRDNGKALFEAAGVAVYREFIGAWPLGARMCHGCDNPPCVNPYAGHVRPGTHKQNMEEMVGRGRSVKGRPKLHARKLTNAEVREIRGSTEPQRALGVRFGVNPSVICRVRTRQMYREVA